MTDSFYQEDRTTDSNPDIEDWSIRGDEADRERQVAINQNIDADDAAEAAEMDRDLKEYLGYEAGVKEQIQELKSLQEKLLPLLKEIKKQEVLLMGTYEWLWRNSEYEDQYLEEDPYWDCESDDDKQSVDLRRHYDYELITPWINQYTPISIEIEKRKEFYEIERRKEENLRAHKKRLGIEDEITPPY